MDYMFHRTLCDSEVTRLVVSYDIACQWSINFQDRMLAMDHEFRLLDDQVHIVFLVPKFHLPAHVASCRSKFSFNYTKGVGRTDGEAPERGWADVNPLAPSTKEMGPGSRRDTMDCHLGDSNWKKVTGFGKYWHVRCISGANASQVLVYFGKLRLLLPTWLITPRITWIFRRPSPRH